MATLTQIFRYQTFLFNDLHSSTEPDYKPDVFVVVQAWPEGKIAFAQFTQGSLDMMAFPMIPLTDFKMMVEQGFMVENNGQETSEHSDKVRSYYGQ